MIQQLATAVETHPFTMNKAAKYLREWSTETQGMAARLDISILSQGQGVSAVPVNPPAPVSAAVMALEPAVSTLQVRQVGDGGRVGAGGHASSPKVTLIFGMAETLRSRGVSWQVALEQAYDLWGKLNVSLASALSLPDPSQPVEPVSNAEDGGQDIPVEDDLDVPLAEFDRDGV